MIDKKILATLIGLSIPFTSVYSNNKPEQAIILTKLKKLPEFSGYFYKLKLKNLKVDSELLEELLDNITLDRPEGMEDAQAATIFKKVNTDLEVKESNSSSSILLQLDSDDEAVLFLNLLENITVNGSDFVMDSQKAATIFKMESDI